MVVVDQTTRSVTKPSYKTNFTAIKQIKPICGLETHRHVHCHKTHKHVHWFELSGDICKSTHVALPPLAHTEAIS